MANPRRLWGGSASKYGNGAANGHGSAAPTPEALLGHKIDTLLQLEDLSDLFSRAFLASGVEGGVEISTAIAPELAGDVFASLKEAEAKTQVGPSPCQACMFKYTCYIYILVMPRRRWGPPPVKLVYLGVHVTFIYCLYCIT